MQHSEQQAASRKRRALPLVLLLLAAMAALAAGGAWLWQHQGIQDDGMEANVVVGPMDGWTDADAQALQDKVDEGMIAFSVNTQVVIEGPDAKAPILFENPANNAKLLKLELTRDDTGETVYATGYLAPGTYVPEDELNVRLEPGAYACTALIESYREDTKEFIGQVAAEVTVTVTDAP